MEKQPDLTRIGLIVVIITVLSVTLFVRLFVRPNIPTSGMVCGTNLKGLGTAITVYANDYDDNYPQLPGSGPWSKRMGFDYDLTTPNFTEGGSESDVSRTITASWYLLVREADVSPKSFICPSSKYYEYEGQELQTKDIVELWDFGGDPHKHVSYAYHNPYGKFPANGTLPADFAVAADMNPWFKDGNIQKKGPEGFSPQIYQLKEKTSPIQIQNSNAIQHSYESQNVLFADGHSANEKTTNVGVKNDNIYTFWSTEENPTDQDRQGGTAPTSRSPENDAKSDVDSFLAI